MAGSCCPMPGVTIIKVGTFESGVVGLKEIFEEACASGVNDDESLARQLVVAARQRGNYITSDVETLYEMALLREYRVYCTRRKQGVS